MMTELEKWKAGELYNPNQDPTLLAMIHQAELRCFEYNRTAPTQPDELYRQLKGLLGSVGERCRIIQPFKCDYGFNIHVGEDFFANCNLVVLDGAPVRFGKHVYIGPNCGFYTAGHPFDIEQRNQGIEYACAITVGDNVWIGGHVCVMPGVSIGSNSVIGAGAVVTRDVPSGVLAAGNPCRVIKPI